MSEKPQRFPPISSDVQANVVRRQLARTGRNFDWKLPQWLEHLNSESSTLLYEDMCTRRVASGILQQTADTLLQTMEHQRVMGGNTVVQLNVRS